MFDQMKTEKKLIKEAPNYYARFKDDIDMTDGTVVITHGIYKQIQDDARRDLLIENAELRQEVEDYKECYESYKSNIRVIDAIINDGDAAVQASLCDLIPQIKVLKHELRQRERQISEFSFENKMSVEVIVAYVKWAISLQKYLLTSSKEDEKAAQVESKVLQGVLERFTAKTTTALVVKERLKL